MRTIIQPITPPIAQMSTVIMLMGMSSARKRFVRKSKIIPRIALMMSAIKPVRTSYYSGAHCLRSVGRVLDQVRYTFPLARPLPVRLRLRTLNIVWQQQQ